jgi:hypothetical protein
MVEDGRKCATEHAFAGPGRAVKQDAGKRPGANVIIFGTFSSKNCNLDSKKPIHRKKFFITLFFLNLFQKIGHQRRKSWS